MKNITTNSIRLNQLLERLFLASIFFIPFMNENGLLTFECGFTVYPSYILGFLSLIVWLFIKINNKNYRLIVSPVDRWLIAFIVVIFLSALQSRFIRNELFVPMSSDVSIFTRIPYLRSLSQAASILFMTLLYFLVVDMVKDRRILKKVVLTVVCSTSIICILSILAAVEYYFLKHGWPHHQILSSLIIDPQISGARGLRLRGLTPEPLIFGAYLASFIPIVVSVYLAHWFNKRFMQVTILLFFVTLFLTFSRGGWLGVVAALSIILILNFKKAIFVLLLFGKRIFSNLYFSLILALSIFLCVVFLNRPTISKPGEQSLVERIKYDMVDQAILLVNIENIRNIKNQMDKGDFFRISAVQWGTLMRLNDIVAGLKMLADHPILGVGWGNYIFQYLRYDPKIIGWWWINWPETQNRPGTPVCCNLFVSVASETGLSGFLIFIMLIITVFRLTIKKIKNCYDNSIKMVTIGLLASLSAGIVVYQFFSTFYYVFFWVFLALLIACGNLCSRKD